MMLKCFKYIFLCILIVSFVSGAVAASDDVEDPIETCRFHWESFSTLIDISPSQLSEYDGYLVSFNAQIVTYNPWGIWWDHQHVGVGELFLLRDGEVIDSKDLSEDSYPYFSFVLEKDYKYSLKYKGTYIIENDTIKSFDDSYKELNIEILSPKLYWDS